MVIQAIYGGLGYTDSKKTVLFTLPTAGFICMHIQGGYVCSIMSLTIRIALYLSVLSNLIINLMYNIIK